MTRLQLWPSLVVGATLVAACGSATSPTQVSRSTVSPTAPPSRVAASDSPAAPVTPADSPVSSASATLSGFSCGEFDAHADGGGPAQSRILSVATGNHDSAGYERFVIRFDRSPSSIHVGPTRTATFVRDGSGMPVTLEGSAGVLIKLGGVDVASYRGPRDLHPGFAQLREAQEVGAFEGQVEWALGLRRSACIRVSDPSTSNVLIVDVATAAR